MVGFDSFQGLPPDVTREDAGVWLPGQFACSREQTEACLARAGVEPDEVRMVAGWYDGVSPGTVELALGGTKASIVMIDCDAYSSAARALELITPELASKAIIFFDDWRLRNVDLFGGGEYRAFNEWRTRNSGWHLERFKSYSRKSEAFALFKI
jgi:hypothetical protein